MRPTDLIPKMLCDELLRLYQVDPMWLEITTDKDVIQQMNEKGIIYRYGVRTAIPTWTRQLWTNGANVMGMWAVSTWIGQGPKVFLPTVQQQEILQHVDINLLLEDYSQPFEVICIKVDLPPYRAVVVHHYKTCRGDGKAGITCVLHSVDNLHDITTTIRRENEIIEESLHRYDEDVKQDTIQAAKALRIALNCCLCLSNHGHHQRYLFPKELESDQRLEKENSERGERARKRISLAVQCVEFSQEVKLHRTAKPSDSDIPPIPTGRTMPTHWRRGHWHTVACGKGRVDRKRVLYPPVLVRADLFTGDMSNTATTYRG